MANCLGAGSWFLQGSSNPDIADLSLLRAPLHSCSSSRRSVKRLGTGRSTSCETDWRTLSYAQEAAVWIINYPSIVTEGPPLTGLPRLLLPFLFLLTAGTRPSQLSVKDKHADFQLWYPRIRKKILFSMHLAITCSISWDNNHLYTEPRQNEYYELVCGLESIRQEGRH